MAAKNTHRCLLFKMESSIWGLFQRFSVRRRDSFHYFVCKFLWTWCKLAFRFFSFEIAINWVQKNDNTRFCICTSFSYFFGSTCCLLSLFRLLFETVVIEKGDHKENHNKLSLDRWRHNQCTTFVKFANLLLFFYLFCPGYKMNLKNRKSLNWW